MRSLRPALFAVLVAPLLLAGCNGDQVPSTAPEFVPDHAPVRQLDLPLALAESATRSAPIEPSHTYRFDFACGAAAPNSLVHITNDGAIGSLSVTCNSSTELGMAYGTAFGTYGVEITLDGPDGKVCSVAGQTRTGAFKCRSKKYVALLTVTDEGELPIGG